MNNRVLVTGGAAGIGLAISERAQRAGWEIISVDRQESPLGTSVIADLSDIESTTRAIHSVLVDGPITRLINNVGAVFPASLEELDLEDLTRSFELNLRAAVLCAKLVLPGMKSENFGRIVNISSRAALGKELRSSYAAAKAGLIGLTRVWALELGSSGITVNAIGPGPIATDLFTKANPLDSDRTKKIIASIPVGRMGEPADVANAAEFFLRDESGFVTGQVLYVCGGMTVGSAGL